MRALLSGVIPLFSILPGAGPGHARSRRLGAVAFALVVAAPVLFSAAPAAAQTGIEADRVMAAFLRRFPQFVEWPAEALDGRDAIELCMAEPDPLGAELRALVEGDELHGRALAVRSVRGPADLEGCHLLFIPSLSERSAVLLHAAAERPVLTVGESSTFLDQGGIINLRVADRRVRFEVHAGAAARSGLRLSSQLLALALSVREGGGP